MAAVVAAAIGVTADVAGQQDKTVRDGVYAAVQAARGKTEFGKVCAKCHTVDAAAKALEGPHLVGATFFNNWEGRSVFDLATSIRLTMPPDGSIVINPDLAADLIAYILQVNKLPAGDTPLKADPSARAIKIVPPAASH
jgi:mono/diheme cytochrome c family protein